MICYHHVAVNRTHTGTHFLITTISSGYPATKKLLPRSVSSKHFDCYLKRGLVSLTSRSKTDLKNSMNRDLTTWIEENATFSFKPNAGWFAWLHRTQKASRRRQRTSDRTRERFSQVCTKTANVITVVHQIVGYLRQLFHSYIVLPGKKQKINGDPRGKWINKSSDWLSQIYLANSRSNMAIPKTKFKLAYAAWPNKLSYCYENASRWIKCLLKSKNQLTFKSYFFMLRFLNCSHARSVFRLAVHPLFDQAVSRKPSCSLLSASF